MGLLLLLINKNIYKHGKGRVENLILWSKIHSSQLFHKKKTGVLLNFKYSASPIGYENSLHIWNCTEKTIYLREACAKFWENGNGCCLICQRKIECTIKN